MPRIIFLNRFFHPDHSATSQIVSDLAFHLASSAKIVHVITSRQLYEEPRAVLASEEVVNGVHIHRLPTTRFGRSSGLAGRAIDYSSCYGLMWHRARALAEPGDILVAKTDPPLTSVVAWRVAPQRQARLVNWLQDVYPETAAELGVAFMRGAPCARCAACVIARFRALPPTWSWASAWPSAYDCCSTIRRTCM
jgi:hypothetical protein